MSVVGIVNRSIYSNGKGAVTRWYDSVESTYIGFKAPSVYGSSLDYTWPVSPPSINGQVLSGNTDGTMAWTTIVSGSSSGAVPVGGIVAWHKNQPSLSTVTLPSEFNECDGRICVVIGSPFYGKRLPNLNDYPADIDHAAGNQCFLRGSTASGTVAGADVHNHTICTGTICSGSDPTQALKTVAISSASNVPVNMTVVWVIRVI